VLTVFIASVLPGGGAAPPAPSNPGAIGTPLEDGPDYPEEDGPDSDDEDADEGGNRGGGGDGRAGGVSGGGGGGGSEEGVSKVAARAVGLLPRWAEGVPTDQWPAVGTDRHCSPCHRMPSTSINEGS